MADGPAKTSGGDGRDDKVRGVPLILNIGLLVSGSIVAAALLSLVLVNWRNKNLYEAEIRNFTAMTSETIAGRVVGAMSISDRDAVGRIVAAAIGGNHQIADCLIVNKKDNTVFYDMDSKREGRKFGAKLLRKDLDYVESPIVMETGFGFGMDATKEKIGLLIIGVRHEDFLKNEHVRSLIAFAQNISRDIAAAVESGNYIEIRDFMGNMMGNKKSVAYAELLHSNGTILYYLNARLGKTASKKREGTREVTAAGRKAMRVNLDRPVLIQNLKGPHGEMILDIATVVMSGKRKLGVVRVGYEMGGFIAEQRRTRMLLVGAAVLFALFGLAFSMLTSIRIANPIRILADAAHRVGEGDINQEVNVRTGGRETRELGRSFNRMIVGLRERDLVKDTFSRYVTKQVAEEILKDPGKIAPGGKKQEVTILFSDIRGFTAFSEGHDPEEVISHLNEYLSAMVDIIFKYEGTLDKFIGDAIMAVFGSPITHGDDPARAVKTALEMQQRLNLLNDEWVKKGRTPLTIGIGINTGEVIVGNIGDVRRMEYTVIGDNVNLASRLEGLTKNYGSPIIISSSTYDKVKDIVEVNKLKEVTVKGKSHAVEIYELLKIKV